MTAISQRLDNLIKSSFKQGCIIPKKTEEGIWLADVCISSKGSFKVIKRNSKILYDEIFLNCAAIKMAKLLALRQSADIVDRIYDLDQEFSKWYMDCQLLKKRYELALRNRDQDRADIFMARYTESNRMCQKLKRNVESLSKI